MSTDRWHRVKDLFLEALKHEPKGRPAFLDGACGDDTDLRRQVDQLIAADSKAEEFMETPITPAPSAGEEGDETLPVDTRIGQYLLRRVISSGGMGTVYEAFQEQPHRTVAIKVMKAHMASKSALRRFEYEAEILAKLRHPNIAHVIEAGTHVTEGAAPGPGMPYFVMEYIPDALPVNKYAGRRRMSMEDRLRLFLQVCGAVHHGHQKGIIHRDLKPGNILVDAAGQVKIIDFGVARATDSDIALTTVHTEVGQLIGTLQYMSPEQCKADPHDLDVRSDVYALGVVLYELLCEELPYDVRRAAVFEAARLIRERPPKRPSTVNRALRGDVETIVLKALEKERDHRYQTVADFSEDLRRYLKGEVIRAKPVGPAVRFWKGVKRNPVVSASVGAAVLVFLAAFGYVVFFAYPQIREERDKAQESAKNAESAYQFLIDMLSSPDPYEIGKDVKVADVLDIAAEKIEGAYADRPATEVLLRKTLGQTYFNLGLFKESEAQQRALLDLCEAFYGKEHIQTANAFCSLAVVLRELGRLAESGSLLGKALETTRRELGEEHFLTRKIMHEKAILLKHLGEYSEAEDLLRRVAELERRYRGEEDGETLRAMYSLAIVLREQGEYSEAEAIHRRVHEIRARILGAEHLDTLSALMGLSNTLMVKGEHLEAETIIRKILESYNGLLGDDHPVTLSARNNLANLYEKQGAIVRAEEIHQEVLKARRRLLGKEHPSTLSSMDNLADSLRRQNRLQESRDIQREVLEMRRRVLGDEHPDTLKSMANIVKILQATGAQSEAESLQRQLIESRRRALGEDHLATLSAVHRLAAMLQEQGRFPEAVSMLRELFDHQLRLHGEENMKTLTTMENLAIALDRHGEASEAEELFWKALEGRRKVDGAEHPKTLKAMHNLAVFSEMHGHFSEMERLNRELLEIGRRTQGRDGLDTLKALHNLARSLMMQERHAEAQSLLQEGVEASDRRFPRHGLTFALHGNYGECLIKMERYGEAEGALKKGYEGILGLFGRKHPRTKDMIKLLIELYEAWGKPEDTAKWRDILNRPDL